MDGRTDGRKKRITFCAVLFSTHHARHRGKQTTSYSPNYQLSFMPSRAEPSQASSSASDPAARSCLCVLACLFAEFAEPKLRLARPQVIYRRRIFNKPTDGGARKKQKVNRSSPANDNGCKFKISPIKLIHCGQPKAALLLVAPITRSVCSFVCLPAN